MRIPIAFALMMLAPVLARAEVKWHAFDLSPEDKKTVTAGEFTLTVETEPGHGDGCREDYLILTVRSKGLELDRLPFESSYGMCRIAVAEGFLLLKYGVGRGTGAREEHVKILSLTESLAELADVQTSYRVPNDDPKKWYQDLVEYGVKVQASRDYVTIRFRAPALHPGLPAEKIVRLRKESRVRRLD
jgi:hypothetical protein